MWFRSIFNAKSTRASTAPAAASSTQADRPQHASYSLLTSQDLRLLNHLALNTAPLMPRQVTGARPSPTRKPASEFREQRQYAPGDDVRYVDWKASARQEHIFIKQSADPKAEMVYLLLDCSASMTWGEPPKREAALALAAMFGYLALAQHDRLMVLPVNGEGSFLRVLGPLWGKGQAAMLNRYLQALPFGGQVDIPRTLAGLSQRKITQGGLVIVLSDLLGTQELSRPGDLSRALAALPTPDWKVVFCHLLHPNELSPHINGQYEMQDIETGQKKRYPVTNKVLDLYRQRLQAWRDQLAQSCLERRAIYTMLPTHASMAQEIIPELQRSQVVHRL